MFAELLHALRIELTPATNSHPHVFRIVMRNEPQNPLLFSAPSNDERLTWMGVLDQALGMQPVSAAILLAELRREAEVAQGGAHRPQMSKSIADLEDKLAAATRREEQLRTLIAQLQASLIEKDQRLWRLAAMVERPPLADSASASQAAADASQDLSLPVPPRRPRVVSAPDDSSTSPTVRTPAAPPARPSLPTVGTSPRVAAGALEAAGAIGQSTGGGGGAGADGPGCCACAKSDAAGGAKPDTPWRTPRRKGSASNLAGSSIHFFRSIVSPRGGKDGVAREAGVGGVGGELSAEGCGDGGNGGHSLDEGTTTPRSPSVCGLDAPVGGKDPLSSSVHGGARFAMRADAARRGMGGRRWSEPTLPDMAALDKALKAQAPQLRVQRSAGPEGRAARGVEGNGAAGAAQFGGRTEAEQVISLVKQGMLTKLSKGGFTANWNRRAFALIGSSLFYAKDRGAPLPQRPMRALAGSSGRSLGWRGTSPAGVARRRLASHVHGWRRTSPAGVARLASHVAAKRARRLERCRVEASVGTHARAVVSACVHLLTPRCRQALSPCSRRFLRSLQDAKCCRTLMKVRGRSTYSPSTSSDRRRAKRPMASRCCCWLRTRRVRFSSPGGRGEEGGVAALKRTSRSPARTD